MKIDTIYVNTHRHDLRFTRTCLSSIRYWYPDIPVKLIVDHTMGPFPDEELLREWNIGILDNGKRCYGWGFGKFEPLFLEPGHHFLVLDADTVLTGPVLDKFQGIDADFIVDEEQIDAEKEYHLYYHVRDVEYMHPGFRYPGYMFNTGQWAGTSGMINKGDFEGLVDWEPGPRLKRPDIFKQADQGLFNFVLHRRVQQGRCRVARVPLMIWPEGGRADFIQLNDIRERKATYPFVVHWAGMKHDRLEDFPRGDILRFYHDQYLLRYGSWRALRDQTLDLYLKAERKLRKQVKMLRPSKP